MSDDDAGLARSLRLLWGTGESPRRGPKPGLTVDEVVRAAIKLADADGLAALSMRKVAERLGVGTMSLYTYVPAKAELIDLMLDTVLAEGDPPPTEGSWRDNVRAWARADWALYHRHEWVLQAPARHALGPNALRWFDAALRGLLDIGLADGEVVAVTSVVDGYTRGMARGSVEAAQTERRTGLSEQQWWAAHYPVLDTHADVAGYPGIGRMLAGGFGQQPPDTFEFGLELVLDGVAARIHSG